MELQLYSSSPDHLNNSERKIINIIESEKEKFKNWIVIPDLMINQHNQKKVGQCDIVLIGPEGLFVIEVKGGDTYKVQDGVFYWGWSNNDKPLNKSYESPLSQAKGNLYNIESYLKKNINNSLINFKKVNTGYGVAHPDCNLSEYKSDIEHDSFQIYDSNNNSFYEFMSNLIKHSKIQDPRSGSLENLNDKQLMLIKKHLRTEGYFVEKNNYEKELFKLEKDQQLLVDSIDIENSRIIVEGEAGTGKTVLAKYLSQKYCLNNNRVLWISFNSSFTREIEYYFSNQNNENIDVKPYTTFLLDILKSNGYNYPLEDINSGIEEMLDEGIDLLPYKYDAVIIDEGQDIISDNFIFILENILKNGIERGLWTIFLDTHYQAEIFNKFDQKIYKELKKYSSNLFNLKINYRNPKKVLEYLRDSEGFTIPDYYRKDDGKIKIIDLKELNQSDDSISTKDIVEDIMRVEKSDVILLTPVATERFKKDIFNSNYLNNFDNRSHFGQDIKNNNHTKHLLFSNISAFKGLESRCIIFHWPQDDKSINQKNYKSLIYTALTRSLDRVYILKTYSSNELRQNSV